ncbi:DUF4245 domain-containing protein [Glaciibacter flavus]|uniref:DUF4245 domain-containing protein n=1 Tax=Orlajensenia flava TaxID=2565934 RepID=A0A4S4G0X3_9MICO|nr:DUF4245 domain-containing protein [Glaciibacter flavus]THG36301.1 DUF4245 domain-containing protein [Glaciibacter flavus]
MAQREPQRVVAELGRPETADETADRKAESSRLHRIRQTPNNLVLSLLATLAAVIVLVLLVPRGDTTIDKTVDYHSVAADAQRSLPTTLADPKLPSGWRSNAAEYRTGAADKVDAWYIGFLTPENEFIGMSQAFGANDVWIAKQLHNTLADGSVTIDGVQWTVYDNRDTDADVGNAKYALVTQTPVSTWLLAGSASPAEFRQLASSLTPTITAETEKR